jgi:hypothetical protein
VAILDSSGQTPDADAALALRKLLFDRIAAVRDGESPGLAPRTLRLVQEDGVAAPKPFYLQIDGDTLPVAVANSDLGYSLETVNDDEERAASFEEIETVDVYFHQQWVRGSLGSEVGGSFYEAVLLRFADEDGAEEYLTDLPERFAANGTVEDFDVLREAPTVGDEAVAFSYLVEYPAGETLHHRPTDVRVGEVVARVDAFGPDPLADGAAAVAEAQADCPAPLEPPADLRAD